MEFLSISDSSILIEYPAISGHYCLATALVIITLNYYYITIMQQLLLVQTHFTINPCTIYKIKI